MKLPDQILQPGRERIVISHGMAAFNNEDGGAFIRFYFADHHTELLCVPRELCEKILSEVPLPHYSDTRHKYSKEAEKNLPPGKFPNPVAAFHAYAPRMGDSDFEKLSPATMATGIIAHQFGNAVVYKFMMRDLSDRIISYGIPLWYFLRDDLTMIAKNFGWSR